MLWLCRFNFSKKKEIVLGNSKSRLCSLLIDWRNFFYLIPEKLLLSYLTFKFKFFSTCYLLYFFFPVWHFHYSKVVMVLSHRRKYLFALVDANIPRRSPSNHGARSGAPLDLSGTGPAWGYKHARETVWRFGVGGRCFEHFRQDCDFPVLGVFVFSFPLFCWWANEPKTM